MADVFISYRNTPDRRIIVRRLATILRVHEISVWWDYGLEAGESYRAQITAELAAARVVSPLWCAESIQSEWVRMEAELGKDKLVPARLQKVVPPDAFEAIQAADLIGWDGAVGSPRLLEFVRLICKRLGRPAIAPTDMIEDLGQLPPVAPLPEVALLATSAATAAATTTHDYSFWKAEWEAHRGSSDLPALKAIAEHAPPYFATQARARIAAIEAERERMARERAETEARQRAEAERIAKEKAAAKQRTAEFRAEGPIKVNAAIVHGAADDLLKPGTGKIEWFKDINIGPEMVVVPGGGGISSFAIGRFALTFAEWDAAQSHPDWQRHSGIAPRKPNDYNWGRGKQPAIDVSWDDAQAYCKWLTAITPKTYRLPTEAEWEHACRAGTKTDYSFGDDAKMLGEYAWFEGNSGGKTHPVGEKKSNQWGLFDVHGNVWEWCEDKWDASSSSRVLRGGSWNFDPSDLCSASRVIGHPGNRVFHIGFRVARTL